MARLLIVLAVLAGACASAAPPSLDVDTVVDGLPAAIWPDQPSLVADVDCPELVAVPIAQSTVCRANLDGESITVPIVVDDEGAVAATVTEVLFDVDEAADELERRLADDLDQDPTTITVTCDRAVMVAAPSAESGCVADRSGDPIELRIVLLDDAGGWEPVFGSM